MSDDDALPVLRADWPAPARVHALQTLRAGGVSRGPYASLNLGARCGDDPADVRHNRDLLRTRLALPGEPQWLKQVHGTRVAALPTSQDEVEADASVTTTPGQVCAVLTADCLPVVLCDDVGSVVAAAHAGWRGLAAGVLEATVSATAVPPERLMAWMGAAIGPQSFEVGGEVRDAFLKVDSAHAQAFMPGREGHWWADLYALARQRLRRAGVDRIYGGGLCTLRDAGRFFSFRRDRSSGRMATIVWLAR